MTTSAQCTSIAISYSPERISFRRDRDRCRQVNIVAAVASGPAVRRSYARTNKHSARSLTTKTDSSSWHLICRRLPLPSQERGKLSIDRSGTHKTWTSPSRLVDTAHMCRGYTERRKCENCRRLVGGGRRIVTQRCGCGILRTQGQMRTVWIICGRCEEESDGTLSAGSSDTW